MKAITPTQSEVMTALRGFIISVLPQGTAQFSGSINGTTLTAGTPTGGQLALGSAIIGQSVKSGTYIIGFGSGSGGAGTYTVNQTQNVTQSNMWTGVPVVQGQVNRVPEPKQGDLVVMWPLMKRRLSTNIRSSNDVAFTGSINGNTMTVTAMTIGQITPDAVITGQGITPGTRILANISGTGGVGTYLVTPSQVTPSTLIGGGSQNVMEPTEYTAQIDVHGPNSSDNAQIISQLFRDDYGVRAFHSINPNVTPLHADDPRQIPFWNGEQQVETRYVINAVMQANYTLSVPAQYADQAAVDLVDIEAAFPA